MKQSPIELSDKQKSALYTEAKKLAAIGSVGAYERAISLLSQIHGWSDSERLAAVCLQKMMVLQAQARQKRRNFIKHFSIPFTAVLIFAFLMFRFVFPDTRYSSSASRESYGSNSGMFSGTDSYSAELLPESGGTASDDKSDDSVGRTAMVSGAFDPDVDYADHTSGISHPDPSEPWNDVDAGTHRTERSASVSTGQSGFGGEVGASGDSFSEQADTASDNTQTGKESRSVANTDSGDTALETVSAGSAAADYSDNNIRNDNKAQADTDQMRELDGKAQKNTKAQVFRSDAIYLSGCLAAILLICFLYKKLLCPVLQYRRAVKLIRSGNYPEAIRIFNILNGYRDSTRKIIYCESKIKDTDYSSAIALIESGRLEEAITALDRLGSYKDSEKHKDNCRQALREAEYQNAAHLMDSGSYEDAVLAFRALEGYKNSEAMILQCRTAMEREPIYREAISFAEAGNRTEAKRLFRSLRGFRDSDDRLQKLYDLDYAEAVSLKKSGDFTAAISAFEKLSGYRDSAYQIECCKSSVIEQKFLTAMAVKDEGRYEDAIDLLNELSDHPRAKEQIADCKKLIRIPRPFAQYVSENKIGSDVRECGEKAMTASGNHQERIFNDVSFLDSLGTLTLKEEGGRLKNASWDADFFWKTQSVKNRGKSAEKQYRKFINYYVSLFGPPVSEYSTNGHKGSWWKSPAITVDCGINGYISINLTESKNEQP